MAKKPQFDGTQKKKLQELAARLIAAFDKGVVLENDPNPNDWWGEFGGVMFEGYLARFTEDYVDASRDFVIHAAKMLKAKAAHEKTIRKIAQQAAQDFIKKKASEGNETENSIEIAAADLTEAVLSEAGKEYIHIVPNFLVRHAVDDAITLGRVRSMRTDLAKPSKLLPENQKIQFALGDDLKQTWEGGLTVLHMPSSIWAVEVASTKENVDEEARWLIDIAVSYLRLSCTGWTGNYPYVGEREGLPTYKTIHNQPHVTLDGDVWHTGGSKLHGWYEVTGDISYQASDLKVQQNAKVIFDPPDKSLAQRLAQGLGWLSRGRQAADRSERLLSFFTALESLLSSDDKTAPVTQTISRYVSVIYSQKVETRSIVFDQVKALYSIRSSVVHGGKRDALWTDVNTLQIYAETVT